MPYLYAEGPCYIRACALNLLVLLYIKAANTNMPQGDRVMKVIPSARRLEALLLHALAPLYYSLTLLALLY